jgi:GNAT superfamily N-acetyltransferase
MIGQSSVAEVSATGDMQIELVDNWHRDWPKVLEFIDGAGQRETLQLDADGWLSARQSLFVAFAGDEVAGYLCFRVRCAEAEGKLRTSDGRPMVEAAVESFASKPAYRRQQVLPRLLEAATAHARRLTKQLAGFGEGGTVV